ncbi:hypothetical protein ACS0Y6_29895 [Burkholderia gladioli]|uniref:hypothetical protein n=1 Tax=Burkholderia gladioli TaxID=28095 RepID=UPI003F79F6F5
MKDALVRDGARVAPRCIAELEVDAMTELRDRLRAINKDVTGETSDVAHIHNSDLLTLTRRLQNIQQRDAAASDLVLTAFGSGIAIGLYGSYLEISQGLAGNSLYKPP